MDLEKTMHIEDEKNVQKTVESSNGLISNVVENDFSYACEGVCNNNSTENTSANVQANTLNSEEQSDASKLSAEQRYDLQKRLARDRFGLVKVKNPNASFIKNIILGICMLILSFGGFGIFNSLKNMQEVDAVTTYGTLYVNPNGGSISLKTLEDGLTNPFTISKGVASARVASTTKILASINMYLNVTHSSKVFAGYWSAATGGTEVAAAATMGTNVKTKTVYAHWANSSITLTLNMGGGYGGTSSKTYSYSYTATGNISITPPIKPGYVFDGYYTSETGGTRYISSAGTLSATNRKKILSNMTLYAHWKSTVVANSNGGVIDDDGDWELVSDTNNGAATQTITQGETYALPTSVSKTGSEFVGWQQVPSLPKEYMQVEYLEATGTQYIDTGVSAVGGIKSSFGGIWTTHGGYLVGSHATSGEPYYRNGPNPHSDGSWELGYGTTYPHNGTANLNTYYDIEFQTYSDSAYLNVNGSRVITSSGQSLSGNLNIWLFANQFSYNNNPNNLTNGKLYYCKIWDSSGILVRNFVPVVSKITGEAGFYDLVYGKFYTNAGTGNFNVPAASNDELPTQYTQVEYIESSGTQRIDTGLPVTTNNIKITGTFEYVGDNGNYASLFGAQTENSSLIFRVLEGRGCVYYGGSDFILYRGLYGKMDLTITQTGNTVDTICNGSSPIITSGNGNTVSGSPINNLNITIFDTTLNQNGNYGSSSVASIAAHARLYRMSIIFDGILQRNFVPCVRNSDGVAGLYDLVFKKFYTNAGTGKFIPGGVVNRNTLPAAYERLEYIEASGAQYIKTGVVGGAIWQYDIQYTNLTNRQLMGHGGSGGEYWGVTDGKYGKANWSTSSIPAGNRDIFRVENVSGLGGVYLNGAYIYNNGYDSRSESSEAQIFAIGGSYLNYCKLWGCTVWNASGTLIRNFVPCVRRSDGAVGLYDTVNGGFYGNSGSSNLIKGPSYPANESYTQVEYIEADGLQQIDTGLKFNMETGSVECTFQSTTTSQYGMIVANSNTANHFWFYHYADSGRIDLYNQLNGSQIGINGIAIDTNKHKMNYYAKGYYIDGTLLGTDTRTLNTTETNLFIGSWGDNYFYHGKIYNVKISNDGVLLRNFVPCYRNSDHVYGLYDTVEGKFYKSTTSYDFYGPSAAYYCNGSEDLIDGSVLSAVWKPSPVVTAYINNNGKLEKGDSDWLVDSDGTAAVRTIKVGDTYGPLPTVSKAGYKLNGWYLPSTTYTEATYSSSSGYIRIYPAGYSANSGLFSDMDLLLLDLKVPTAITSVEINRAPAYSGDYTLSESNTHLKLSVTITPEYIGSKPDDVRRSLNYITVYYGGGEPSINSYSLIKFAGNDIASDSVVSNDSDHIIVADLFPIEYTIKYNGNGNTGGSMSSSSARYNNSTPLKANAFTKTGYTFAGWATSASGDVVYADEAWVNNLTTTDGDVINLYAKWTVNTYKTTFDLNGGGGIYPASYATTSTTGGGVTYSFDASTGNVTFNGTQTASFYLPTIYLDKISSGNQFAVTYSKVSGTTTGDGCFVVEFYPASSRQNIDFSNTSSGGNSRTVTDATTIASSSPYLTYWCWFNTNHTFTNTVYNVKLALGSSKVIKNIAYNSTYGAMVVPYREGYEFDGWYTAASGGTKVTSTSTMTTAGNQTLYAHWIPTPTVTAYSNVGGLSKGSSDWTVNSDGTTATKIIEYGDTYGTLPTVSKAGYTFDSWYLPNYTSATWYNHGSTNPVLRIYPYNYAFNSGLFSVGDILELDLKIAGSTIQSVDINDRSFTNYTLSESNTRVKFLITITSDLINNDYDFIDINYNYGDTLTSVIVNSYSLVKCNNSITADTTMSLESNHSIFAKLNPIPVDASANPTSLNLNYGYTSGNTSTITASSGSGSYIYSITSSTGSWSISPTYFYTAGAATLTFATGQGAGSYSATVLVTDANGTTKQVTVTATVNKVAASYTTKPTAKTGLVYNGTAQALVNAGSSSTGTVQYSFDNATWSSSVPQKTNAGTYTVYFKIVGDANHSDTASESVSVTIAQKDLTITTQYAEKVYDGTPLTNHNYTQSGLVSGDSITTLTFTGTITNVGEVNNTVNESSLVITRSSTNVTSNYRVSYVYNKLKITPATLQAPTVNISVDGIVTWNSVTGASGYSISIDGTNFTSATSGINYLSVITAAVGLRTVYVKATKANNNYLEDSIGSSSVTVYQVLLTTSEGIDTVSGAGKYISGKQVTINATTELGYIWKQWETQGGTLISTTKEYTSTITSDWDYIAVAAPAEAKVGDAYFETLKGAFDYANTLTATAQNPTVIETLKANIYGHSYTVNSGKFILLKPAPIDGLELTTIQPVPDGQTKPDARFLEVNGNFTLTDGITINGYQFSHDYAAGIYVNNGTFNMTGGTISYCNNTYYAGGAIYNESGIFNMTGGTITHCQSKAAGGGVMNLGTFNMSDGTISYCSATGTSAGSGMGGGVNDYDRFTMTGGSIDHCSAGRIGGNVKVTSFTMTGGSITNGSANIAGDCIYVDEFAQSVTLGGSAHIDGEIYLAGSKQLTVNSAFEGDYGDDDHVFHINCENPTRYLYTNDPVNDLVVFNSGLTRQNVFVNENGYEVVYSSNPDGLVLILREDCEAKVGNIYFAKLIHAADYVNEINGGTIEILKSVINLTDSTDSLGIGATNPVNIISVVDGGTTINTSAMGFLSAAIEDSTVTFGDSTHKITVNSSNSWLTFGSAGTLNIINTDIYVNANTGFPMIMTNGLYTDFDSGKIVMTDVNIYNNMEDYNCNMPALIFGNIDMNHCTVNNFHNLNCEDMYGAIIMTMYQVNLRDTIFNNCSAAMGIVYTAGIADNCAGLDITINIEGCEFNECYANFSELAASQGDELEFELDTGVIMNLFGVYQQITTNITGTSFNNCSGYAICNDYATVNLTDVELSGCDILNSLGTMTISGNCLLDNCDINNGLFDEDFINLLIEEEGLSNEAVLIIHGTDDDISKLANVYNYGVGEVRFDGGYINDIYLEDNSVLKLSGSPRINGTIYVAEDYTDSIKVTSALTSNVGREADGKIYIECGDPDNYMYDVRDLVLFTGSRQEGIFATANEHYLITNRGTNALALKGETYTITYYCDAQYLFDADGNQQTETSFEYSYKDDITLLINRYQGYIFDGWQVDTKASEGNWAEKLTNGEVDKDHLNIGSGFYGDVYLKLLKHGDTYTLIFDGNGHEIDVDPVPFIYGSSVGVSNPGMTALPTATTIGYVFKDWYKTSSYSGKAIKLGTLIDESAFEIDHTAKTATVYAKWDFIRYKVLFDADGGEITLSNGKSNPATISYDNGNRISAFVSSVEKYGYTLTGWKVTNNLDSSIAKYGEQSNEINQITSETILTSDIYFKNLTSVANTVVTITAQWSVNTYELTYNTDGGSSIESIDKVYDTQYTELELPTPTKEGYEFNGWFADSEFSTRIEVKDIFNIEKATFEDITVDGSIANIFAKWNKLYTIVSYFDIDYVETNDFVSDSKMFDENGTNLNNYGSPATRYYTEGANATYTFNLGQDSDKVQVKSITVNNETYTTTPVGNVYSISVSNINENKNIVVILERKSYQITVQLNNTPIVADNTQNSYHLTDSMASLGGEFIIKYTYNLTDINTFESETFTTIVSSKDVQGNSITVNIRYNDNVNIYIIPYTGYGINSITYNSQSITTNYQHDVMNMRSDSLYVVQFKEQHTWLGYAADKFAMGDGSEQNPYQIRTAEELAYLSKLQLTNPSSVDGKYFILKNNIDLSNSSTTTYWYPIGNEKHPFKGHFNGDSFTINNINVENGINVGLFGYVDSTGTIYNVKTSGSISGSLNVGGIVGYNKGSVNYCGNGSTVSDNMLYPITDDQTRLAAVGGVVGFNDSATNGVTASYNTGSVNGNAYYMGGVVGYSKSNISNAYNRATIRNDHEAGDNEHVYTGGIVGYSEGNVEYVYNTGTVGVHTPLGALAGSIAGGFSNGVSAKLNNAYYLSTLGSYQESSSVYGKTQAQMTNSSTTKEPFGVGYSGIYAGWNNQANVGEIWEFRAGENDSYPVFVIAKFFEGTISITYTFDNDGEDACASTASLLVRIIDMNNYKVWTFILKNNRTGAAQTYTITNLPASNYYISFVNATNHSTYKQVSGNSDEVISAQQFVLNDSCPDNTYSFVLLVSKTCHSGFVGRDNNY